MNNMLKIVNPRTGADPELFLADSTGKIVSAIGKVGGTKELPRLLSDGFYVQEDNVMVEFNIPPAENKEQFSNYILSGIDYVNKVLPTNHSLVVKPSHIFDLGDLTDEKANTFGCEPDYNAWTGEQNTFIVRNNGLRSCGGHIHIGYDNPDYLLSLYLVTVLDKYLGVPSVIMDKDKDRKKLYGKAGCCRLKPYGVEYRVLSSFWLSSPELINWVHDQVYKAIDFVNKGGEISEDLGASIQLCINTNWEESAFEIIAENPDITILI